VWQALLSTERQHESLRLRLAGRPLFSPREAFKFVDRDGNGAVTPADLRDAMALNGFFATENELALVLNKFGRHADQRVTQTEWVAELAPRTASTRRI
jgi:Ca2+-binding EF-hand superfamily protein